MPSVFYWFISLLGLEALSAWTIFHPEAQTVALIFVSIVMFFLAWKRPVFAVGLLVSEHIIGSKGALLRGWGDGLGHGGIPLRMAWFGAFFLGWLCWAIQHKTYRSWITYLKDRQVYVVLAAVLVYAFLRGLALHNPYVFADANAWGAWMLLLPALDLATYRREEFERGLPSVLLAAVGWLCLKTLGLFYVFTHVTDPVWLEAVYLWVRRTGVGEITRALEGANAWRIFFQSHIFLLPLVIGGVWYAAFRAKISGWGWVIWVGGCTALIISLSRSLFLGAVAGGFASILLLLAPRFFPTLQALFAGRVNIGVFVGRCVCVLVASFLLVAGLFYAPPRSSGSLVGLLVARTDTGDAASMSRWKLLPILLDGVKRHPVLGSGFGATVTYRSSDPRVVAATGGMYTTYAFEWGWLDHWFKFGVLGIPLLLAIVVRLIYRASTLSLPIWIRGAIMGSLVGLMVTHLFTPYLNHPLGIIWLIMVESLLPPSFTPSA